MNGKRRHLIALLLPAFLLTGCFDLGTLNDPDDSDGFSNYYKAFEDVKALTYDPDNPYKEWSYDLEESLVNDATVNSFSTPEGNKEVSKEEYLYIIVEPKQEMNVQQVMLYCYSEAACSLNFSVFYVESSSDAYEKPRFKDSPVYEDDDPEKPIEYDDPDLEETEALSVYNGSLALPSNSWNGIMMEDFRQQEHSDKLIHMASHSLLYIRINNNSGYYENLQRATFSFIDLIIRAV